MPSFAPAVRGCSACPLLVLLFSAEIEKRSTRHGHCSCRLALYRAGVVDIELDMLARKRACGSLRRAIRRVKAVPRPLRNDSHHSRAEQERLRRPVIAYDFQGRRAVEDMNQLVAARMGFPMIFPRELDGEKEAVAV